MTDDDILRIWTEEAIRKDTTWEKAFVNAVRRILAEAQRDAEPITEGVRIIAIERNRQITSELWTAMHDAEHDAGELAAAGAAYAINAADQLHPYSKGDGNNKQPAIWPWADSWWKPKNPQRDLARAGALIAAELDRLYAAPQRTAQEQTIPQVEKCKEPASAAVTPRTQLPLSKERCDFFVDHSSQAGLDVVVGLALQASIACEFEQRINELERENAELRAALEAERKRKAYYGLAFGRQCDKHANDDAPAECVFCALEQERQARTEAEAECKAVLLEMKRNGIHVLSRNCWCNPIVDGNNP